MKQVQEQIYEQRQNAESRMTAVPPWIAAIGIVMNGIMPACREREYLEEVQEWAGRIEAFRAGK